MGVRRLQAYLFFTMVRSPPGRAAADLSFSLRKWTRMSSVHELGSSLRVGGARRDRTDDLLLAKQALSQLSYGPKFPSRPPPGNRSKLDPATGMVGLERFELSTSRLSSARSNQLSYRPGKRGLRPYGRKRNEDGGVPQFDSKNQSIPNRLPLFPKSSREV